MSDAEGGFYLGRVLDDDSEIRYDPGDLTTHGVIVGMIAKVDAKNLELAKLESDLAEEVTEIVTPHESEAEAVEPLEVGLEKTDIRIVDLRMVWLPAS